MSNDIPSIAPPVRTDLRVLTDTQADQVRAALADIDSCRQSLEALQGVVNGLLGMVKPDGATGFDVSTMTFYSEETPSELRS